MTKQRSTPTRSLRRASVQGTITLLGCAVIALTARAQSPGGEATAQRAVAARITAATQLGPQQAALAQYLGKWSVDILLPGQGLHSSASAEYAWVIEGRWLGCRIKGTLAGQPFEEYSILGYDSYAQSLVEVTVESADNSMLMARGASSEPPVPTSELYGELDEYFSGALHRPYKVVLRRLDAHRHVTEVWDLGAEPQPVEKVRFTFTRGT